MLSLALHLPVSVFPSIHSFKRRAVTLSRFLYCCCSLSLSYVYTFARIRSRVFFLRETGIEWRAQYMKKNGSIYRKYYYYSSKHDFFFHLSKMTFRLIERVINLTFFTWAYKITIYFLFSGVVNRDTNILYK